MPIRLDIPVYQAVRLYLCIDETHQPHQACVGIPVAWVFFEECDLFPAACVPPTELYACMPGGGDGRREEGAGFGRGPVLYIVYFFVCLRAWA
jgi:hypothetical protein